MIIPSGAARGFASARVERMSGPVESVRMTKIEIAQSSR